MEKILNDPKHNNYGFPLMNNKYIYMERSDSLSTIYFIYQIKSILHGASPVKYSCNRLYILNVPKDKNRKAYVYDNATELELSNNDMLYEISFNEYLKYFKSFINISDTLNKTLDI